MATPHSEFLRKLAQASNSGKVAARTEPPQRVSSESIGGGVSLDPHRARAQALEARRQQLVAKTKPRQKAETAVSVAPTPAKVSREMPKLRTTARDFVQRLPKIEKAVAVSGEKSSRSFAAKSQGASSKVAEAPAAPTIPTAAQAFAARFNERFKVPSPQQSPSALPAASELLTTAGIPAIAPAAPQPRGTSKAISRPIALRNVPAASYATASAATSSTYFTRSMAKRGPPTAASKQIAPQSLPLGAVKSAKKGCGCGRK